MSAKLFKIFCSILYFLLLFDILCACSVVTSIDFQREQTSISCIDSQNDEEISLERTSGNADSDVNVGGNSVSNNFNTYNNKSQQQTVANYVLNTSTMKFHRPECRDVPKIAPQNYSTSDQLRDELISNGYSPCGHCNP